MGGTTLHAGITTMVVNGILFGVMHPVGKFYADKCECLYSNALLPSVAVHAYYA